MDAALMQLVGPIVKFAVGSIVFFAVLTFGLVSQRRRITKQGFRITMKTATIFWLLFGIWFFYRLAKHLNP